MSGSWGVQTQYRARPEANPSGFDVEYERPRVSTTIPGPLSAQLLSRQAQVESNARTYPRHLPIAIKRAQGSYVEDVDGNVFIDFLTGAGSITLGHSHPEIVEAVREQLAVHIHGLDFPTLVKDEFVSAQLTRFPPEVRDDIKVHFCGPTGANAVDAALKLCKVYTGRSVIVAFQGSYHGSTHSTLAVSGIGTPHKQMVGNLMPGVHFLPYPYELRCPLPVAPGACGAACADYFERSITDPGGGIPRPAAVIIELVQGEGGAIPAPLEFIQAVRALTSEVGIPLIIDEVQTGCGRTGTWYAFEQYGIVPDVVIASKGVSGIGLPVAMIFYRSWMDRWNPGAHIGTFRGHQLAFAAGTATLRIVERDGILENVMLQGAYAMDRLRGLQEDLPLVAEIRGKGLMIGVEIVDPETMVPDAAAARAIQRRALMHGLIIEIGGGADSVIRLLPPLNVDRETLDRGLRILEEAIDGVARGAAV